MCAERYPTSPFNGEEGRVGVGNHNHKAKMTVIPIRKKQLGERRKVEVGDAASTCSCLPVPRDSTLTTSPFLFFFS